MAKPAKPTTDAPTTKAGFCRSFGWAHETTWLDLDGFVSLPRGRVARVTLVTGGVHGEYVGFMVSIVSTDRGPLDAKTFLFDDYLDVSLNGRADGRADYGSRGTTYKVISHTGWHWYIAQPKTTAPLTDAVAAYIEIMK